jgi:hypothetical protein
MPSERWQAAIIVPAVVEATISAQYRRMKFLGGDLDREKVLPAFGLARSQCARRSLARAG